MKKTLIVMFLCFFFGSCSIPFQNIYQENITLKEASVSETTSEKIEIPEEKKLFIVTYTNEGFIPQYFNIQLGETVRFINASSLPMWVASGPHPIHTDFPEFDALKEYIP